MAPAVDDIDLEVSFSSIFFGSDNEISNKCCRGNPRVSKATRRRSPEKDCPLEKVGKKW
jgi:hypothetical protein